VFNVLDGVLSLAGFQVTLIGRFWVTAEGQMQNQALTTCVDLEELLLPHRLECPWNDVWCWGRDGRQQDYSHWRKFG